MKQKICLNCNKEFPYRIKIDNKWRNLKNRIYCFECSPYGKHNTLNFDKQQYKDDHINEMRICGLCNLNKPFDDFFICQKKNKRNGLSTYCKKCTNIYQVKRWIKLKIEAIQYKGGSCIKCGYNKYYGALEFHHSDPKEKDYIWDQLKKRPKETIFKELDKCILVCSNCHKETHRDMKYNDFVDSIQQQIYPLFI